MISKLFALGAEVFVVVFACCLACCLALTAFVLLTSLCDMALKRYASHRIVKANKRNNALYDLVRAVRRTSERDRDAS